VCDGNRLKDCSLNLRGGRFRKGLIMDLKREEAYEVGDIKEGGGGQSFVRRPVASTDLPLLGPANAVSDGAMPKKNGLRP